MNNKHEINDLHLEESKPSELSFVLKNMNHDKTDPITLLKNSPNLFGKQNAVILYQDDLYYFDAANQRVTLKKKQSAKKHPKSYEQYNECYCRLKYQIADLKEEETISYQHQGNNDVFNRIKQVVLPQITYFIDIGDSLSDTGEMDHRRIMGLISGATLSGLNADHSSMGRFTNGLVWVDDFALKINKEDKHKAIQQRGIALKVYADDFEFDNDGYPTQVSLEKLKQLTQSAFIWAPNGFFYYDKAHAYLTTVAKPQSNAFKTIGVHKDTKDINKLTLLQINEIAEVTKFNIPMSHYDLKQLQAICIKKGDQRTANVINQQLLNNYHYVKFDNQLVLRKYAQGGLTAASYTHIKNENLQQIAEGHILSNLDQQCARLLEDDRAMGLNTDDKKKAHIIQLAGGNDMITINNIEIGHKGEVHNRQVVDKAIDAIINNTLKLQANGYRNFTFFNMPNLAYLPRFQNLTGQNATTIRTEAKEATDYFNQQLQKRIVQLNQDAKYGDCTFNLFDIASVFQKAFLEPEKYGFNSELKTRYLSEDFKNAEQQASRDQYMFWNDVHPSAKLHELIFDEFHEWSKNKYYMEAPKETPEEKFKHLYGVQLAEDKRGLWGFFRRSRLTNYLNSNDLLEQAFKHAIYDKGYRTKKILMDLGWINQQGLLILDQKSSDYEAVSKAYKAVQNARNPDKNLNNQLVLIN